MDFISIVGWTINGILGVLIVLQVLNLKKCNKNKKKGGVE